MLHTRECYSSIPHQFDIGILKISFIVYHENERYELEDLVWGTVVAAAFEMCWL